MMRLAGVFFALAVAFATCAAASFPGADSGRLGLLTLVMATAAAVLCDFATRRR